MSEVVVTDMTTDQQLAIGALHNAMGGLIAAVMECDSEGIPLADAFEAIGMEIPLFLRPMVNQLASKLPSKTGTAELENL